MNDWSMRRKLIWLHVISGGGSSGARTTVTGTSPLTLANALAKSIRSLIQYGKVTTSNGDMYCNNGKLTAVDDELPSGYTRITGIKFDGDFWYDTGEVLNGDDIVTMTLANTASSGQNVFGSYNGTGSGAKNFSLFIYGGGSSSNCYFRYGSQLVRPRFGSNEHTITFGHDGTSGFDVDVSVTPDEFTTIASAYIGMLPNSSSAAYTGSIIGEITVGTRLKWIPCERVNDGVIGYYEAISGTFLEPVGTGTPVAGSYDTSHLTVLAVEGTPEVLTIGEQTASVANLFAVDDIKDEQNIISGTVTRRCEAVISDGTTPSGRYIGEVGEGNIIVKVRGTGYEGDVATFEADRAKPLNGLTVNVEPIQDLHGYDSPWPAGGGRNKFNLAEAQNNKWVNNTTGEIESVSGFWITGFIPVKSGDVIRSALKGSARNAWYNADKSQATYFAFNGEGSATAPSDGFVVLAVSSSTVAYGSDFIVTINNADLTFSPYSNICPISGRTSATVTRTGKNLLNLVESEMVSTGWNRAFPNPIKKAGQYTISCVNNFGGTGGQGASIIFASLESDFTPIGDILTGYDFGRTGETQKTATVTEDQAKAPYICFRCNSAGCTFESISNGKIQLELGSTASAYEPYAGNTYTIQIGDTVYGGTLDVTGGVLTVDRAVVDLGTLAWGYESGTAQFYSNGISSTSINWHAWSAVPPLLCSQYKPISNAQLASSDFCVGYAFNSKQLRVKDSTYTDAATFKTAMSGVQLVYELATPIEITLTPTQIDTLLGTNNIWSDAGTVKAYVADGDLIEHVTAQPMRTAEGTNTVSVTSAVAPVQLSATYTRAET